MGRAVQFPNIIPTARTYTPAKVPERIFKSINGAETRIQYGSALVEANLSMTFANISENSANAILDNYYEVVKDDGDVVFQTSHLNAVGDIDNKNLKDEVRFGGKYRNVRGPLAGEWKYKSPPTLTFVGVNRVTVRVDLYTTVEGN